MRRPTVLVVLTVLMASSLLAQGDKPPALGAGDATPPTVRPERGRLYDERVAFDVRSQLEAVGGAVVSAVTGGLQVALPQSEVEQYVDLKPPGGGLWDLRAANAVRLVLRNTGGAPLVPVVQLLSTLGNSDVVQGENLPPGGTVTVTVPFDAITPWRGGPTAESRTTAAPGTGTLLRSDAVRAVRIRADHDSPGELLVDSVIAIVDRRPLVPGVGLRPPVPGDWYPTLDETFSGSNLRNSIWQAGTSNRWDPKVWFSPTHVSVRRGDAVLELAKALPNESAPPPAVVNGEPPPTLVSGRLDSFERWQQRYGYFETRVRLPKTPGVWASVWLEPSIAEWVANLSAGPPAGYAEFNLLDHLTGWGPNRYGFALRGYKAGWDEAFAGSPYVYAVPDPDGYLTVGLLWTPGSAVFYEAGREVGRMEGDLVPSAPACWLFALMTGGWDQDRLDEGLLPARLEIDYVRAWQRRDLASADDTLPPPPAP